MAMKPGSAGMREAAAQIATPIVGNWVKPIWTSKGASRISSLVGGGCCAPSGDGLLGSQGRFRFGGKSTGWSLCPLNCPGIGSE